MCELFQYQKLVTNAAVKAFCVAVLPGTGRLDIQHCDVKPGQPFLNGRHDELCPVRAANVIRQSV